MGPTAVRSRIAANISVPNADVQMRSHVADVRTSDPVAVLVERAKLGDRDAFGELYRACYGPLFRAARFHLGAAAEDVVAETFLRAGPGSNATVTPGLRSSRGSTASPGTSWPTNWLAGAEPSHYTNHLSTRGSYRWMSG